MVATTSTLRVNPPVRSSSSTTSRARSPDVDADASPAYTRTGSIASEPVTVLIWAADGPPATKSAPCRPNVCHAIDEDGPADR